MASKFKIGDTVRLTGEFLRNTGQFSGPEGLSRWKVVHVDSDGQFLCVDELKDKESLAIYTPEELTADPLLRNRRFNTGNLERVP